MATYKKSFIIPGSQITPMEHKLLRDTLSKTLQELLQNDGKVLNPESAVVRDGLANADFAVGNANAQNWVTGACVANTVLTYVNNALANNKYAGFYGCANWTSNPSISSVRFAVGTTGGATRGRFQSEALYALEAPVGFFPDPVVYGPTETIFVEVVPVITNANGEKLTLYSMIAEPKGPFVS